MPILNTPVFIFHNALDFFDIGKKKTEEIFKTDPTQNPYLWYHLSAPAVNLAFSLELMFKTILLIEKGKIEEDDKQHRLSKLYQKISLSVKDQIVKNFDSQLNKAKYPAFRFSAQPSSGEKKIAKPNSTEEVIQGIISTHDNSFIGWRYSFELSEIENKLETLEFDFGAMIKLINATARYLKEYLSNNSTEEE